MVDTEEIEEGVVNELTSFAHMFLGVDVCPVVDGSSKGYGNISLAKVLNIVRGLAAPAACASEGTSEFPRSQPNPRQSHMLLAHARPDVELFLRHRESAWERPKEASRTTLGGPSKGVNVHLLWNLTANYKQLTKINKQSMEN